MANRDLDATHIRRRHQVRSGKRYAWMDVCSYKAQIACGRADRFELRDTTCAWCIPYADPACFLITLLQQRINVCCNDCHTTSSSWSSGRMLNAVWARADYCIKKKKSDCMFSTVNNLNKPCSKSSLETQLILYHTLPAVSGGQRHAGCWNEMSNTCHLFIISVLSPQRTTWQVCALPQRNSTFSKKK